MVTDQIDLILETPIITGQAALPMLTLESRGQLLARGLVKPGVPFYILSNRHGRTRTWTGRGKAPGWVREWQEMGGNMADLEAVI